MVPVNVSVYISYNLVICYSLASSVFDGLQKCVYYKFPSDSKYSIVHMVNMHLWFLNLELSSGMGTHEQTPQIDVSHTPVYFETILGGTNYIFIITPWKSQHNTTHLQPIVTEVWTDLNKLKWLSGCEVINNLISLTSMCNTWLWCVKLKVKLSQTDSGFIR